MYPAVLIGWKVLAKIGLPIMVTFAIAKDDEANVYIGKSVGLKGVYAEAATLEELFANLKSALDDVLYIELKDTHIDVKARYEEHSKLACA